MELPLVDNAPPPVEEEQQINPIHAKLPPFWSADPQIWFAQVEAQFITRHITRQRSKFALVISALQPEIAQEVRDLLLNPPEEEPYNTLKFELIRRTSASQQRRLQLLLIEEELGDRKPSQLLRRMRQLLGENELEADILKQLFVQRLPANVQLILATASTALTNEQLADLADRIMDVPMPAVQIVQSPPITQTLLADLKGELIRLSEQVRALQVQVRNQSRSRSRGRDPPGRLPKPLTQRSAASSADAQSEGKAANNLCWYHEKWGNDAHKCRAPCAYTETPAGNA